MSEAHSTPSEAEDQPAAEDQPIEVEVEVENLPDDQEEEPFVPPVIVEHIIGPSTMVRRRRRQGEDEVDDGREPLERLRDTEEVPRRNEDAFGYVQDSFSDISNIAVVPAQTERLPPAPCRLVLETFNEEELKPMTDEVKEQLVPVHPKAEQNQHQINGYFEDWMPDTIDATHESFDYTETSSILRRYKDVKISRFYLKQLLVGAQRYMVVIAIIGPLTAFVAVGIEESISYIAKWKYETLAYLYNSAYFDKSSIWWPAVFGVGFNAVFAAIAHAFIAIAPEAQGSGIPQIKCFLNGIVVPKVVRIKTLFCKCLGVIFSVTAGFPVGKEGPMIHSGAVIGAGMSQGKATSCVWSTGFFKDYRIDHEKRDFIACGSAAGVAAAFGAPMGGLLFAIEEGASHVNQNMLWICAISSCISYFVLGLMKSVILGKPGQLSNGGLISFGEFDNAVYNPATLAVFVGMGIFGAISGAFFVYVNKKITEFRKRHTHVFKRCKALEAIATAMAIAILAFVCATYFKRCEIITGDDEGDRTPFQLNCPYGQTNSMADLCKLKLKIVIFSLD